MGDHPIIRVQPMLVTGVSCLLCVVPSFAHVIHSRVSQQLQVVKRDGPGVQLLSLREDASPDGG